MMVRAWGRRFLAQVPPSSPQAPRPPDMLTATPFPLD